MSRQTAASLKRAVGTADLLDPYSCARGRFSYPVLDATVDAIPALNIGRPAGRTLRASDRVDALVHHHRHHLDAAQKIGLITWQQRQGASGAIWRAINDRLLDDWTTYPQFDLRVVVVITGANYQVDPEVRDWTPSTIEGDGWTHEEDEGDRPRSDLITGDLKVEVMTRRINPQGVPLFEGVSVEIGPRGAEAPGFGASCYGFGDLPQTRKSKRALGRHRQTWSEAVTYAADTHQPGGRWPLSDYLGVERCAPRCFCCSGSRRGRDRPGSSRPADLEEVDA